MKKHIILTSILLIYLCFMQGARADYGFAGEQFGSNGGLGYLRNRYYDPVTGSFIAKDPLGISGGSNAYLYVADNPANNVDPMGTDRWVIDAIHGYVVVHDPTSTSGYTRIDYGPLFTKWYPGTVQITPDYPFSPSNISDLEGIPVISAQHIASTPDQDQLLLNFASAAQSNPPLYSVAFNCLNFAAFTANVGLSANDPQALPAWQAYVPFVAPVTNPFSDQTSSPAFGITSVPPVGGVLINSAAQLVGTNLSNIKGATYDPTTHQIIFLGSNQAPSSPLTGINMDYFYTAIKAVYGSATPPYVTLVPPATPATQWPTGQSFLSGTTEQFIMSYAPLWAGIDTTVAVRFRVTNTAGTLYDFTYNFNCVKLDGTNGFPPVQAGGRYAMGLVYSNTTGTPPSGLSLNTNPFVTGESSSLSLTPTSQSSYWPVQLTNNTGGSLMVQSSKRGFLCDLRSLLPLLLLVGLRSRRIRQEKIGSCRYLLTQATTQNGAVTQTLTYTYGTANQLVQIVDQTGGVQASFVYDAAGNRIQKSTPSGDTLYNYDERNLLPTVITPSDTITYTYNGSGQRVSKNLDGVATNYIIDPNQSVFKTIQEWGGGSISKSYSYGFGRLEVNPIGSASQFNIPDRLGSVRMITDPNGKILQTMNYDAFGYQQ